MSSITEERLNIVVPTRNRFDKLVEMLKTIPQYEWMELHLGFDGDRTSFEWFSQNSGYWKGEKANLYFSPTQIGSIKMRNMMTAHCEGAILWATDDIKFRRGSIEAAWSRLWIAFPDGDGVVGFRVINAKPLTNFCWTGVGIMGGKFLARYPKKMISFPGYFHFGTREIETLSKRLKKLWREPDALIFHDHPDFNPKAMDATHMEARAHHEQDVRIKKDRLKQGLIWGFGDETDKTYSPDLP